MFIRYKGKDYPVKPMRDAGDGDFGYIDGQLATQLGRSGDLERICALAGDKIKGVVLDFGTSGWYAAELKIPKSLIGVVIKITDHSYSAYRMLRSEKVWAWSVEGFHSGLSGTFPVSGRDFEVIE